MTTKQNKEPRKSTPFARRMQATPKSFIREILKVTEKPEIISFAGGLPNPELIDTAGLAEAAAQVFCSEGKAALQYATTEGYLPLRQFIADRYRKRLGLDLSPEEILITNGSQQCLDLVGKVLLDPGDRVVIERPGYLGAIQVFSLYEPVFVPVGLDAEGPEPAALEMAVSRTPAKIFYGIPNSQNPSGITYSEKRRRDCAGILEDTRTMVVEDDAYGELQFTGKALTPLKKYLPDQILLTGSFSKIMAPGMRLGWICAPHEVMEQLVVAKQASDLHSNYLSQRIAARYLEAADIDAHVARIREAYHRQAGCMIAALHEEMPDGVHWTQPEGGMFVWIDLPRGCPAMEVFNRALEQRVAVLPGIPFYTDGGGDNALRLNFSNSNPEQISEGIRRLGTVVRTLCA